MAFVDNESVRTKLVAEGQVIGIILDAKFFFMNMTKIAKIKLVSLAILCYERWTQNMKRDQDTIVQNV